MGIMYSAPPSPTHIYEKGQYSVVATAASAPVIGVCVCVFAGSNLALGFRGWGMLDVNESPHKDSTKVCVCV